MTFRKCDAYSAQRKYWCRLIYVALQSATQLPVCTVFKNLKFQITPSYRLTTRMRTCTPGCGTQPFQVVLATKHITNDPEVYLLQAKVCGAVNKVRRRLLSFRTIVVNFEAWHLCK
jgi:hypothetical protein